MDFNYIKNFYKIDVQMHQEVIVDGKKGVITKDMGSYIGVNFYDSLTVNPLPCHPTWEVTYLNSFNHNPPVKKQTASQKRYQEYLNSDSSLLFIDWVKSRK